MKIFLIIIGLLVVIYWWMIFHAMEWDPRWDEPLRKEDDDHEP